MKPTTDTDLIKSIAAHPRVWPRFGGTSDPADWTPPLKNVVWLVNGGFLMGFFKNRPEVWEVHVCCLPGERGDSVEKASNAFNFMRNNTTCRVVTGLIKTGNIHAKRLAERVGMRVVSVFDDHCFVVKEL